MAVTQVGTTTTAQSTNGTSVVVTKPTGTAYGDVLMVFGASNEGAWTIPSGFVQFQVSVDGDMTGNFRAYGWYKVCTSSEPANYTFGSATALSAAAPIVVSMTAWRGVDNWTPIDSSSYSGGGAATEPANPTITCDQSASGRLFFCRALWGGATTSTMSTATTGWSELSDSGATTGAFSFSVGVYAQTADTGAFTGRTEPAVTAAQSESGNVYFLGALLAGPISTHSSAEAIPVTATAYDATVTGGGWSATKADATVTAYDAGVTGSFAVSKADATATAYDATTDAGTAPTKADATATAYDAAVSLASVAQPSVASVSATAYDAMGWVIHPVDVGAVAFNATVAIGPSAGYAAVSATAYGSAAYYGAPESRRWRIPAEDRTWTVEAESRSWAIAAEDRSWAIPSED